MFPLFFDAQKMDEVLASLMDGHVRYQLGSKVWHPARTDPEDVDKLDCSGFVEYVVFRTTQVDIPSGSWNQEDWFEERFPRVDYALQAPKRDGFVRVAFRDRTRRRRIRHCWLVINGRTYESTTRERRDGPTSFEWSKRRSEADDCFLLGPLMPIRFGPYGASSSSGYLEQDN